MEDAKAPPQPAAASVPQSAGPAPNAFDPLGVSKASFEVWRSMLTHPDSLFSQQMQLASAWLGVATRAVTPAEQKQPAVIEPARNDSRFKHPAWTQNPMFDALKQGYLLATQAVLESVDRAPDVDDETKQRVKFFAKQFCDAMSPTNFPFLNPAVIEETIKSGGANLQRGLQNVLEDARDNEGWPALVDKSAFEVGRNVAASKGAVIYRNELIELIQYAPTTATVFERPLVITPPWINKFYILDLQPKNSFIKFATDHGFQTFVISWRNPGPEQRELGWDDYLELGPLAACRVASSLTGSPDVNLIGYCIGGTLTSMMLAYLARTGEQLVNAFTLFASMVDFSEAGEIKNFLSPQALAYIEEKMRERGVLEASEMAGTFNMLRANDLIWNVAVNRYLLGLDAPAFDLLFWNSDSTRLPAKMHSYYLRNMYVENNLVKPDALSFKGVPIDLREVHNDTYAVATIEDHIAPWRSAYKVTQNFSGDVRFRLGHSGHIAGIINSPSNAKGNFWEASRNPPTPEEWLAIAQKHPGSWWPQWAEWLGERSGEQGPASEELGSKRFSPLAPAPGTYVAERA
jgi:polyhydroxyalkanoate synthase